MTSKKSEIVKDKILQITDAYKRDFKRVNEDERYKWEAVGCYKRNWNIEAENFSDGRDISFCFAPLHIPA